MIAVSHTKDLAMSFGREVRNIVLRHTDVLGYDLEPDSKAAGRWDTTHGGGYFAVGIDGNVTGRRADLLIIDDPVKNPHDVATESSRNSLWDFYTKTLLTRLRPGGRIVIVMTRWHEDDLGGRVLAAAEDSGETWDVVRLPAICDTGLLDIDGQPNPPDPLGRGPGEALWPEWEDVAALTRKRSTIGESAWSALFQQTPRPPLGTLFDVTKINIVDNASVAPRMVRSWDLAATQQVGGNDPDWTVGVLAGMRDDGTFVIYDVRRVRGTPAVVEQTILEVAQEDGPGIPIRLPEDPGQAGKGQSMYLARILTGFNFSFERETGSKIHRATAFASQVEAGNVSIVRAGWNMAFLSELRDFPGGRKDDQVDAAAAAFNRLATGRRPMRISESALAAAAGQVMGMGGNFR